MRSPDWSERFVEVIEHHRRAQFAWGTYDCATLLRDTALALGAHDPWEGETWSSALSAMLGIRKRGAKSVREYIRARLEPIDQAEALRGDVGFTDDHDTLMCPAIVVGAEAVSRNEVGWIVLPRTFLVECYRLR